MNLSLSGLPSGISFRNFGRGLDHIIEQIFKILQSKTWATFGFIFAMPAMIPTLLVEEIGFVNIVTGGLALVVGFIMEFVSVYALVYFPTRFVFRRIYDFRAHKTVV